MTTAEAHNKIGRIRHEITELIDYVATCENLIKNAPDTYRPNYEHIANARAKIDRMRVELWGLDAYTRLEELDDA